MGSFNDGEIASERAPAPAPRKFALAVDSENKATQFRLFSFAAPHMRTFHLSWFSFFTCFVSTFAAPPLLPVIRDNLNLTSTDIGNAGIASVSGAVFARLVMGSACDLVGPRLASSSLILITTPPVYFTACIDSSFSFFLVRFLTGFSLASFVSCQFWMSSMFNPTKVGIANGVAAGWGNLGGGATQLIMPLVFDVIKAIGGTKFTAWRVAFFIPGIMQTASALAVMILGQDLPDGNFRDLLESGEKAKDSFPRVFAVAVRNYRAWITALCYGYCFGVELAIDNIIAEYFYDRFDLNLRTAGIIAASFGLANFFSRPGGGFLSDALAERFGMRGRLWGWWVVQSIGGVLCIWLGKTSALGLAVFVMLVFSVFVQAACGLAFGVVPFVSRRYSCFLTSIDRRVFQSPDASPYSQVSGVGLGVERRRRKRGGGIDAAALLQGDQIRQGRRHHVHGDHDPVLHSPDHAHLLPNVGRNVGGTVEKGGRHRRELLRRRVERGGEGQRPPSQHHQVRRELQGREGQETQNNCSPRGQSRPCLVFQESLSLSLYHVRLLF